LPRVFCLFLAPPLSGGIGSFLGSSRLANKQTKKRGGHVRALPQEAACIRLSCVPAGLLGGLYFAPLGSYPWPRSPSPTAPLKFSNTGEEGLLFQRALLFLLFAFLFHFKERGLPSHARAGAGAVGLGSPRELSAGRGRGHLRRRRVRVLLRSSLGDGSEVCAGQLAALGVPGGLAHGKDGAALGLAHGKDGAALGLAVCCP